jgi:peptidoglycan/xylan/chitin deacetylase (PgdA/CDA1 family)
MTTLRTVLKRTVQIVLCAAAIAGGALVAQLTYQPPAPAGVGVFPPAMPEEIAPAPDRAPIAPEPIAEVDEPAQRTSTFGREVSDGLVMSGATSHRLIMFTFDDGPDPRNTPRLLDHLDTYGVRAVFFLTASRMRGTGAWVEENRELAREIVRRGHLVGNHTVDHAQLPTLDNAQLAEQIDGADEIFTRVLGSRSWLLRPPGGARSARVDRMLASRGYTQMMWNLGTGDFQVRSAEEVLEVWTRVLARREREHGERGGIVLLHDTHAWSVDAFPMIMSYLRDRNCELLEQGEELYDIVDDPAVFHVARADQDASVLAPPAAPEARVLEERQALIREATAQRCAAVAAR